MNHPRRVRGAEWVLPLCWASGFPREGCDARGEKRPLCSIKYIHPEPGLWTASPGEIAEHRGSSSFPPPPSAPGYVHSNPSSECELPCLTFFQQSLREETILGARVGWEGSGRWRERWASGRHRQAGRWVRMRLISSHELSLDLKAENRTAY